MPRRRHPVWENFKCITNKNTGRWAVCKTCKKGMQGIPYRLAMHRQKCEVKSNIENEKCRGNDRPQESRGKNGDNLQLEQKLEVKVEESRVSEICPQGKQQYLKTAVNSLLVDNCLPKRTPEPQIVIKREVNSEDETPPHSIIPNNNKYQQQADNPTLLTGQVADSNLTPIPAVRRANDNSPIIASQKIDDCQTVLVEEMDYEQQESDSCPSPAAQRANACSVLAVQSPDDCDSFRKRPKLAEDTQPRRYGKNNDCDLFGEYISGKMKQFDHKTRCVVQYLMSHILFQADIGTYREGSFDCQSLIGCHASNKNSKSSVNECNRN